MATMLADGVLLLATRPGLRAVVFRISEANWSRCERP